MFKHGRHDDLKRRLYSDFCNVPMMISVGEEVQFGSMLRLIETTIELWFDRDLEDFDNKKMKRDWNKITNMLHGTRKLSDRYLEAYGELGAPPKIVLNPSVDDK